MDEILEAEVEVIVNDVKNDTIEDLTEDIQAAIPDEELEVYDFNANEFVPEDSINDGVEVEEEPVEGEDTLVAPTTHGIEEVILGTLEEV